MSDTVNNYITRHSTGKVGWLVAFVILAVIIADQVSKFYVKTHFYLGESYVIFPWFELRFIENNGMAFGMELFSKYLLTFGRIAAVAFFIWYIRKAILLNTLKTGFFISGALIIAGAAGNIFDCVFYGEIFNNPFPPEHAVFLPAGGGYAGWFEGKVVDMLYFPLFTFTWPDWMPVVGGSEYEFFKYIFNIADASICVGVGMLLLFYSGEFSKSFNALFEKKKSSSEK